MKSQLKVDVTQQGRATVISLAGELDLASGPQLQERLERAVARAPAVVIDLRGLEFMDSTGLSLIVKAHRSAEGRACRLYLVRGQPQVQRLLELTGLAERLEIVDDPATVVES